MAADGSDGMSPKDFSVLYTRLTSVMGATPPATPGKTPESAAASGKKRKAADKNDTDDEGADATPTKAKAKRGRKAAKKSDQKNAEDVPMGESENEIKVEAADEET